MFESSTDLGVEGAFTAALVAAIGILWKVITNQTKGTEKRLTTKLDECEKQHDKSNQKIVELSEKVGNLAGQMEGHRQAREDLKLMSQHYVRAKQQTSGQ